MLLSECATKYSLSNKVVQSKGNRGIGSRVVLGFLDFHSRRVALVISLRCPMFKSLSNRLPRV